MKKTIRKYKQSLKKSLENKTKKMKGGSGNRVRVPASVSGTLGRRPSIKTSRRAAMKKYPIQRVPGLRHGEYVHIKKQNYPPQSDILAIQQRLPGYEGSTLQRMRRQREKNNKPTIVQPTKSENIYSNVSASNFGKSTSKTRYEPVYDYATNSNGNSGYTNFFINPAGQPDVTQSF